MSETTEQPKPLLHFEKVTRKRAKRTPGKPRAPRVKDPGILEIERKAAAEKAAYRKAQESGGVLKRIVALIPRLTVADLQALAAEQFVKNEWAPSLILSPKHGLQTGVEALGNP